MRAPSSRPPVPRLPVPRPPAQRRLAGLAAAMCLFWLAVFGITATVNAAGDSHMTAASRLTRIAFADLDGWPQDRHAEAFAAFRLGCAHAIAEPPRTRALGIDSAALVATCRAALALPAAPDAAIARRFFERHFDPHLVEPSDGRPFLTGYFEPEVPGSLTRTDRFAVPLYRRPADLVEIDANHRPAAVPPGFAFGRAVASGGIVEYHDRAAIEAGALRDRGLELVWLEHPVDAFFIQVQGSARIRLADGSALRIAYDGKTGHPYTSIGRILVERGVSTAAEMTLDRLRAWIEADPAAGRDLMRQNRSFVFFRPLDGLAPELGAIAAAGVQITPGRSLAVDRTLHTFGTPVWIEADLPLGDDGALQSFRRLMIAQDTGSAIVGPARGDVFVGLGADAGLRAGRVRHEPRRFVVLVPRPDARP